MIREDLTVDPLEVETLTARQDRHRDLADLGRREDEFGMLRRFLERLQQGVEGRGREHVDLVDDIDLVARRDRGIADALKNLPDIADTGP